jgi:hypothetical protein
VSPSSKRREQVALFPFEIGGLWVEGGLLGASWALERDGYPIVLSLPSAARDFGITNPDTEMYSVGITHGTEIVAASVSVFQVAIWVESEASPDHFPPEEPGMDGQRALNKASQVALSIAEDFVALLRTEASQYWLGASHEPPTHASTADLIDIETGKRIKNVNWEYKLTVMTLMKKERALGTNIDRVVASLKDEVIVREPDLLLADARETLFQPISPSMIAASEPDTRRAVLLAAMASEIKIRETIRERTPPDRQEIVELFLSSYREVDAAIAGLPGKAMKAAVGRSLKDEDVRLFKAVGELFTLRNGVVHRGVEPNTTEARKVVTTAVELSAWLDDVLARRKSSLPRETET